MMNYQDILNQDGLYIPLIGNQKIYPMGYCLLVKNNQAFMTTFALSHNEPISTPVLLPIFLSDCTFKKVNREDLYNVSTTEEVIDAMKIGYSLFKENDSFYLESILLHATKIPVSNDIAQEAIAILKYNFLLSVNKNADNIEYSSAIQIYAVMPEVINRTHKPYKFRV